MGNTTSKNKDASSSSNIVMKYSNRTGAYMNYWNVPIGEYCNGLIPISLKNDLISQSQSLIDNKQKLNYRNVDLTNKNGLNGIQIQDLIEPCNPSTINHIFNTKDDDLNINDIDIYQHDSIKYEMLMNLRPNAPIKPKNDNINSWIPAVFQLNKQSKTYQLMSEINDLPKNKHPKLYKIIESIFNKMIPNINRCLNVYPFETQEISSRVWEDTAIKKGKSVISEMENAIKSKEQNDSLYDEYHVIIKMTDYQFMNQISSSYVGGNFHSEGFDKEHIKAVALYYFDVSDNIKGGGLSFLDPTYRHFGTASAVNIEIRDNECVFFTNDKPYKHKVNIMEVTGSKISGEHKDKNGNEIYGTRKLLGFFIIDPDKYDQMISSKEVIVNFAEKASLIISHWYRSTKIECDAEVNKDINVDVSNIIKSFICGDMEYIKKKTDNYRKQRYTFGQEMSEYEEKLLQNERESMRGVCD